MTPASRHAASVAALTLAGLTVLTACEPPVSTYRRSALRPAVLGGVGTAPAQRGQVQVSGAIASADAHTATPDLGDPAMHVARNNVVGRVQVGLTEHIALGGQAQGGHYRWSTPSADGTPPLLDERLALGFGANLSLHTGARRGFHGSLGLSATAMEVPWATFELQDGEAERCPPCDEGPPRYRSIDSGTEVVLLYNASATGGYYLHDKLGWYGGLSAQNTIANVGFTNRPMAGSTITSDSHQVVPYLGMIAGAESGPFFNLQLYLPWDDEVHGLNPGVMASVGLEL